MSNNTIKYFMWGYQKHMNHSIQFKAENLFKRYDLNLNPKITFIGLSDVEDRHSVCVERGFSEEKDEEEIDDLVKQFSDVKKLAKELEKFDPQGLMMHTHPIAQQKHLNQITTNSYRKAIEHIIRRNDYHNDKISFVSFPVKIDVYQVFIVLDISKTTYSKHYSLRGKDENRFLLYRSFLEAICYEFIIAAEEALHNPDRGLEGINVSDEEIIKKAARKLTHSVVYSSDLAYGYGLYDACNEISSLKYEGGIGYGSLIVCEHGISNIKMLLELKEPIPLHRYRKVRKILEMSNENASIITDTKYIYGLGVMSTLYNPVDENIYEIRFIDHFEWVLYHNNIPMMNVKYSFPSLPSELIKRKKFDSDSMRLFKDISKRSLDDLWDIVLEATKQKHGTLIVISEDAKSESDRLGNQCFEITPQKLSLNMIQQVTSIDGALLIDTKGVCYAAGLILDGLATNKGDSARGARYNSAVRYYEHFGKSIPTMLVIVSEDGMINIIPDLKPQIAHEELQNAIERLKELEQESELNVANFNGLMNYFKKMEFYLTVKECSEINDFRKRIESSRPVDEIRIIYEDLIASEEMNDSYYQ